MFATGYGNFGSIRGVPVRVHWSTPLGAIAFTGFTLTPGLWLGFVLLLLIHELGHAAIVLRLGYRVTAIRVHGFGGDCSWKGNATEAEVGAIAWGGVLAQGAAGLVALGLVATLGSPTSGVFYYLAHTFLGTNLRLAMFNLLPIPGFDGHRAWPLLPMLWQARRERRAYLKNRAEQQATRTQAMARERARAAVNRELDRLDTPVDVRDEDLAPMPPELQAVLDRIAKEGAAKRVRKG